jgi:SAM-dependent methyltransferase
VNQNVQMNSEESQRQQTNQSFKSKWDHWRTWGFSEETSENSDVLAWILKRNGIVGFEGLTTWLEGRSRILDAGCGNGRITALLAKHAHSSADIVAVDLASYEVARSNLGNYKNISVVQGDLLSDLTFCGEFDFIYCQEVLHHTGDPKVAFENLVKLLAPGGLIAIYVYKEKGPVREFTDDHIRNMISGLNLHESLEIVNEITSFARDLSKYETVIKVPRLRALGIEAGDYTVQRLLYHFFFKNFWNSQLSFEENQAVNFDWYHPSIATRHKVEEVRNWFSSASVDIVWEFVDEYGITLHGLKPQDNK